jgi:hypothetical protein
MSKIYNKSTNEIGVNAIYDGNHLDMDLFVNDNGIKTKMHTILDNEDLSKILNIPIVSEPLEKRLQRDFLQQEQQQQEPIPILIPIPSSKSILNIKEPFLRPISDPKKEIIIIKSKKRRTKREKRGKKKTKKSFKLYKTPSPKIVHIHLKPKTKSILI